MTVGIATLLFASTFDNGSEVKTKVAFSVGALVILALTSLSEDFKENLGRAIRLYIDLISKAWRRSH